MKYSENLRRIIIAGKKYRTRIDLENVLSPEDWALLERLVKSGEIEDHSQLKEFARRKWSRLRVIQSESLELTREAVAIWKLCDEPETRLLVANAARNEWGQDTHVEFNTETMSVTVEHFDGRSAVIGDKGAA